MAKQTINIGSSANDNTAESVRSAFDKANDNFTELYGSSGSWTPTLSGGSTAGTQGYSKRTGRYLRMGDLVFAWFQIDLSSIDNAAAGSAVITGLPAAPSSSGADAGNLGAGGAFTLWDGVTLSSGQKTLGVRLRSSGGGDAQLIQSGGGSAAVLDITAIDADARLRGFLVYEAAAS